MPCPDKLFAQRLKTSEVFMIAFEVSLNGNKVCNAGVGDVGVLTTIITWVRRNGVNTETREPENLEEELKLDISGLITSRNEYVRWSERKLAVGDEILIRVTNVESVDSPRDRRTEDPTEVTKREEKYVERMAKRFGWTIQK